MQSSSQLKQAPAVGYPALRQIPTIQLSSHDGTTTHSSVAQSDRTATHSLVGESQASVDHSPPVSRPSSLLKELLSEVGDRQDDGRDVSGVSGEDSDAWVEVGISTAEGGDSGGESDEYDTDIECEVEGSKTTAMNSQSLKIYTQTCRKVKLMPVRSVCQSLRENHRSLVLTDRGMGHLGALAVCNALTANTHITKLRLDGNQIGTKGARYVALMLRENSTITELCLNNNNIGTGGVEVLAQTLRSSITLTKVNLQGNNFLDSDAVYFADVLERSVSIQELDLSYNEFGDIGLAIISSALANNDYLRTFSLAWNKIRPEGVVHIAEALQENVILKSLDLSMNGLALIGCRWIAEALGKNDSLECLDISNTRILDHQALYLAKALSENESLRTLKLNNNPLTVTAAVSLLEAVKSNPSTAMESLEISPITVSPTINRLVSDIKMLNPNFQFHTKGLAFYDCLLDDDSKSQRLLHSDPLGWLHCYMGLRGLRAIDIFSDKQTTTGPEDVISLQSLLRRLQSFQLTLTEDQIRSLVKAFELTGMSQSVNIRDFLGRDPQKPDIPEKGILKKSENKKGRQGRTQAKVRRTKTKPS